MSFIFKISTVGLLFAVSGCGDVETDKDTAVVKSEDVEIGSKSTQAISTRIVVLDAPTNDDTPPRFPVPIEVPAPDVSPEPIIETVLPNGTVLFTFGNRFARPLIASIDCNGDVTKSHNDVSGSRDLRDTSATSCDTAQGDDQ